MQDMVSIIDSFDDAIAITSLDGAIVFWNSAAKNLFGYKSTEAIGQSINMLSPSGQWANEPVILKTISNGEKVPEHRVEMQSKNGKVIHISTTIYPINNKQGDVVGVFRVIQDISEIKKIESNLSVLKKQVVALAFEKEEKSKRAEG